QKSSPLKGAEEKSFFSPLQGAFACRPAIDGGASQPGSSVAPLASLSLHLDLNLDVLLGRFLGSDEDHERLAAGHLALDLYLVAAVAGGDAPARFLPLDERVDRLVLVIGQ